MKLNGEIKIVQHFLNQKKNMNINFAKFMDTPLTMMKITFFLYCNYFV